MKSTKISKFAGIDNRTPPDRFARRDDGALPVRDAVNTDLSPAGSFQRRAGSTKRLDLANPRALRRHGKHLYLAAGADLCRFDGTDVTVIDSLASPIAPVCYAEAPFGLVWSDSFSLGLITGQTSTPLAVPTPNPAPSSSALVAGSLPAGTYAICFAAVRADGRRSAMTEPSFVEVLEGGGLRVAAAVASADIAVFVSAANGDMLYREGTLPAGGGQLDLTILYGDQEPLAYEPQAPLPAGTKLAYHDGRLLSARGPMVAFTKPYELSTYRPHRDYILLDQDVTLLASTDEGLYLATSGATYFVQGELTQGKLDRVANFGAVPGTMTPVPNSRDLHWFSSRGPVRAKPNGEVELLQDQEVAYTPASAGASLYRESGGLRTLITALQGEQRASSARMGVYMDAYTVNP